MFKVGDVGNFHSHKSKYPARVVATDVKGNRSLLILYLKGEEEQAKALHGDGSSATPDLYFKKGLPKRYANVYGNPGASAAAFSWHTSKEDADIASIGTFRFGVLIGEFDESITDPRQQIQNIWYEPCLARSV